MSAPLCVVRGCTLGLGNCIFLSTYSQVSDTIARGHSLWHGQWLCPRQGEGVERADLEFKTNVELGTLLNFDASMKVDR